MADTSLDTTAAAAKQMHDLYLEGGKQRQKAPHVVYADAMCPHADCDQRVQAIDFRLEEFGKDFHDPLVRAWWEDTGFTGQCPACGGWIHFTIQEKRAIDAAQAEQLPNLPRDWFAKATIL